MSSLAAETALRSVLGREERAWKVTWGFRSAGWGETLACVCGQTGRRPVQWEMWAAPGEPGRGGRAAMRGPEPGEAGFGQERGPLPRARRGKAQACQVSRTLAGTLPASLRTSVRLR